jgi:hypothetical protein
VQQEALGTSRFEASSFKQRYEANDSTMCGNAFMEQPVVGLQDVITEAPIQSSDVIWPGGCDAYMPYVTLEPGLHWDADRGTSAQLSNGHHRVRDGHQWIGRLDKQRPQQLPGDHERAD